MRTLFISLAGFLLLTFTTAQAEAPKHFYNAPENLHPDPNHTPGEFPLADIYNAKNAFQLKKQELVEEFLGAGAEALSTLGIGEVMMGSLKNESAKVTGYFRNYYGMAQLGDKGPESLKMLIDINSLDTAVPGRNHRILNIFFESMKPEFGHALVEFNKLEMPDVNFWEWNMGETYEVKAWGTIQLNGVIQPVAAVLEVSVDEQAWVVRTQEPVSLLLSDFNFGNRIYELMKSCNHQSMGNTVEVNVELYFR